MTIVSIVYIFLAAIFTVCLVNALFPKWCWKVFESWKASKEPSKAYFCVNGSKELLG